MPTKGKLKSPERFIRPMVRKLDGYVPGEQPQSKNIIKLNTNENPISPSPKVLRAIQKAADSRLRLYPNPTAKPLRSALAQLHCCQPENIIIGNGSDELLALATRCFVEPKSSGTKTSKEIARQTIQYFTPSYSLYPILADIHGARKNEFKLSQNYKLPNKTSLIKGKWNYQAALTYITTPNAPSGAGYKTKDLAKICKDQNGIIILDEAYIDFAEETALGLTKRFSNVIISRTFSKSYSLCSQRIGYFIAHSKLIAALDRIRDSYNTNELGQTAALATLTDLKYYQRQFKRIIKARSQTSKNLTAIGFDVIPSQTNFIFAKPKGLSAKDLFIKLRKQKIITRWFDTKDCRDWLRITIGTERDMEKFILSTKSIVKKHSQR
ncbi:MAG: histidinol-phosphate transaminase [Verrucomicrobiota bacterium]|jgi:histidinol-phosphate aminotransferase|nr:histidinol-phosphate transaminase [Verrucomicrobiota bacterium]